MELANIVEACVEQDSSLYTRRKAGALAVAVHADCECDASLKSGLQRKATPTASSPCGSPKRSYRRSCHGTIAEQQQALRTGLGNNSPRDTKQLTAVKEELSINSTGNADACASHQSDQQEVGAAQLDQNSAVPDNSPPAQAGEQEAEDAAVMVTVKPVERPPSPFAAPEVQACTCYKRRLFCKMHNSRSSKNNTGTGSPLAAATAPAAVVPKSEVMAADEASQVGGGAKNWMAKTALFMCQGMALCKLLPSAAVPGMGGMYINAAK